MNEYKIGDVVTGKVTGVEDYGIFLSFGNNCSGLVHISEISDAFVNNVNDYANINESLTAMIIGVEENNHYRLSIKELNPTEKKQSRKIKETEKGFTTLSQNLDSWIEAAYAEIGKKN